MKRDAAQLEPSATEAAARLREALRDPAKLIAQPGLARAEFVLRSHALQVIDGALSGASRRALLVKGASLALTVYPRPWQRSMDDIDMLVLRRDRERVLAALEQAGCRRWPKPEDRLWSLAAMGETPMSVELGRTTVALEVHTQLDKVVARPVPYGDILRRSLPLPELSSLRTPCPEDHALLVALHAASSGFTHPVGLVDLELLLRGGLDMDALERRARRWKLRTALYVALSVLRALAAPSVTEPLVARFEPPPLRRRAVAAFFDAHRYPTAIRTLRLGWPWMLGQTPLREDGARWAMGLCAYAGVRAVERSWRRLTQWRLARELRSDYIRPGGS